MPMNLKVTVTNILQLVAMSVVSQRHIYTYFRLIYKCKHTYIHVYVCIVGRHAQVYICICACLFIDVDIKVYIYMHKFIYMFACLKLGMINEMTF